MISLDLAIDTWLEQRKEVGTNYPYEHLVLNEIKGGRSAIFDDLRTIVEGAYQDARSNIRALLRPDLDPLANPAEDPAAGFPSRLHASTLMEYFGEIFAGIVAVNTAPLQKSDWKVPVLLFRFHNLAFEKLEYWRNTGVSPTTIPCRTGDDCLAFRMNAAGSITDSLVCEAKCLGTHSRGKVRDALNKLSLVNDVPVDLYKIIDILKDSQDEVDRRWVEALRRLSMGKRVRNYARFDQFTYLCGNAPVQQPTWISDVDITNDYKGGRVIHVAELSIADLQGLVRNLHSDDGC